MNYPALSNEVPAHILASQNRAALLEEFMAGITGGTAVPTIRCSGTRFVFKRPNEDDETFAGLELPLVALRAKPQISKKWYATKFVQGQEPAAPDCFSNDGITPDPSSKLKQCTTCAGCPQNEWGSGTNASGEPGKGKACADIKEIAVYVDKKGIFSLPLMPTALNRWKDYCKKLGAHGRTPADVITVVGFDPDVSFPSFTFNYMGDIPAQAYPKLQALMNSDEVLAIVDRAGTSTALGYSGEAAKQIERKDDGAAVAAEAAKNAEAEKKKAAAEEKKRLAEEKKKAEEAKAAEEAASQSSMDLGLGGGSEGASDDEIASLLGL